MKQEMFPWLAWYWNKKSYHDSYIEFIDNQHLKPLSIGVIMLLIVILRPVTTTLHELGHAIPALIFTKGNVEIYIGSYQDLENSFEFNFGRLRVFFIYDPLQFRGGLCSSYSSTLSKAKRIIILASGALFAFAFALSLTFIAFVTKRSDTTILISLVLLLSTLFDLFINLIPNKKVVVTAIGKDIYNDGRAILNVLREPQHSFALVDYTHFEKKNSKVTAKTLSHKFFIQALEDFKNGNTQGAIENYTWAIDCYNENPAYYNNRGYCYQQMKEYHKSIADFNEAIQKTENFAYAYNNRGFSYLMLDQIGDGLTDILKSLSLNKNNAYAIRNLGIYYFKKGEYLTAKKLLNKAIDIDVNTPLVNDYLTAVIKQKS